MKLLDRFRRTTVTAKIDAPPLAYVLDGRGTLTAIKSANLNGVTYGLSSYIANTDSAINSSPEGYALAWIASVWANRCVEVRSKAVSRMPWKIIRRANKQDIPNHPLAVALRRSKQRIIRKIEWSQLLWGETFILPLANAFRYKSDVYWLNNLAVNVTTAAGYLLDFQYAPVNGGKPHIYKRDAVAYWHTDNPFDDLRGLSKFETVLLQIGVDRDMARTAKAWYTNGARPSLMLIPENDLNESNAQAFMDFWNANLKGAKNFNKTILSPRNIREVKELNAAPREDDVELREDVRREICAEFGVPLSIAGAWDDAQYQSAPEQRRSLYEETVIPECEDIAYDITNHLLPFFDDSGESEFVFDPTEVMALIEDTESKATAYNGMLTSGGMTLNEYRKRMNLSPVDGGDTFYIPTNVSKVPLDAIAAPLSNAPAPASEAPQIETAQLPAPEEGKATQSACIMLDIGSHPDLIDLQAKTKQLLQGTEVSWNAPDDFHCTLLYAPSVTDEQVHVLRSMLDTLDVPLTELAIGSLNVFDNLGEYAVHFRIRRNSDLYELQETLYDYCQQAGIATSAYSQPAQYKPHITMGYASQRPRPITYDSKLRVTPQALTMTAGESEVFRKPLTVVPSPVPPKAATQDSAADELRAWEKKAVKSGAHKAFECKLLPEFIAESLRHTLQAVGSDEAAVRIAFICAKAALEQSQLPDSDEFLSELFRVYAQLAVKSYEPTRAQFVAELLRVIGAAQADETTRRKFASEMRSLLRRYGLMAFRDGMNSVGYDPESLSAKELDTFRSWQSEQSGYVTNFGAEIFKQGITENEVSVRANMWADVSLRGIYLLGVAAGDGKQRLMWKLGLVENHCPDCLVLSGQVHTAEEWINKGILPGNGRTVCRQGCDCDLVKTDESVRGNYLN